MTLNITVLTRRYIYQSADYRLLDFATKRTTDFETQKIVFFIARTWSASICFSGVGRAPSVDVSEWLAEIVRAIPKREPLDYLIGELLKAEDWLNQVSASLRRHSFSIGAFVGGTPLFVLISNFERPDHPPSPVASGRLNVFEVQVRNAKVFLSGDMTAVTARETRRLKRLALRSRSPAEVESALVEVNRAAAARSKAKVISQSCFTTYLRPTGEGGGTPHGMDDNRPFMPTFALPVGVDTMVKDLLNKQFGPGGARMISLGAGRAVATSEYHHTQLRDKPNDPDTYSNYGAFLLDVEKDLDGAESAYRKALAIDPKHVNALGNLANLLRQKGDAVAADEYYQLALDADPRNENASYNYASFIIQKRSDYGSAIELLTDAIAGNDRSGRLLLLRAQCSLLVGDSARALSDCERAREIGAQQADVEAVYACALYVNGAPIGECIAAYRVALALRPNDGSLKLNLAQALFIRGQDDIEATRLLREATATGLDDASMLEAHFYRLAHTDDDPFGVVRDIRGLLSRGATIRWDMEPTIGAVARKNQKRADVLRDIWHIMRGDLDRTLLEHALRVWQ